MKYAFVLSLGWVAGLVVAGVVEEQDKTSATEQSQAGNPAPDGAPGRPPRGPGDPGGRGGRGPNGFGGGGGFGGGFGGPPGFGGQEREVLKQFDKNSNGYLDKDERVAAREFLKKQPAPGGGPGRGPGGGRGGFGGRGFDPINFLSTQVLEGLDTDKDGHVSREELDNGAQNLFAKPKDGEKPVALDQKQMAEMIGRLVPSPGPFGGFGGGRPDGGPRDRNGPGGRPEAENGGDNDRDRLGRPGEPGREPPPPRRDRERERGDGPDRGGTPGGPPPGGPGGPGGFGPPGGFGGFGPPRGFLPGSAIAESIFKRADQDKNGKVTQPELLAATETLLKEIDKDKDGKLALPEMTAAIALLMPRPPGFGPLGGLGNREPGKPGPKVSPSDVKTYADESLYEPNVLRTFFLEFEDADWEAELSEFHNTDVEVPATLTVDGKKYSNVGVTFRGMSSYGMVPAGSKRSFNVSVDLADEKQRVLGYKTLNLLNAHEDPSFMSTVLYSHVARQHIPAPKANFVKVVVNGESWGVYVNTQQFNKEFIKENYDTEKGTRWKVRGSPGGGGGLEYLGDNIEEYKRRYQMKSSDGDKTWKRFIELCRVLNETPPDQLEAALEPILDIDATLWFLALDVGLINNDGYWVRASDYSIYLDLQNKFHMIPHDMNEAFHGAMGGGRGPGGGGPGFGGPGGPGGGPGFGGPGGGLGGGRDGGGRGRDGGRPQFGGGPGGGSGGPGGGPRAGGVGLDPLVALDDARKPLRSKLLAVPQLKARYLEHIQQLAADDLNWEKLEPVIAQYRTLLEPEVKADTRKQTSFAEFEAATSVEPTGEESAERRPRPSLRSFIEQRRAYLLKYTEPVSEKVDTQE